MNKIVIDGYIAAVSTAKCGKEITEQEYNELVTVIRNKPTDPEGFTYKLRADNMDWELVEMPEPEPIVEEAGPEDYEHALEEMGVDFSD